MSRFLTSTLALTLACIIAGPAFAHVTLEKQEATVGGGYKAVFRVPHGCKGQATSSIRVQIPEGVVNAKPMPKAGWTLEKVKGKYANTYKPYGHEVSEGVKEIEWKGGNLPDDEYDEFTVSTYLDASLKAGTTLYFPVVQSCVDGSVTRWIEIPVDGKAEPESPAPGVKLIEKK
ncbi:MAG TPA: DUF1775 domain-containing protein [Ensifer sp.]|nr:DUF1775 domain-containing protein [Ensifer sp.]